ncbi:MAG TPA: dCMP deaminase family protein [Candidatus Nanoarchaeia archaeon]|nr:dCMP deaminase family protein [Candidatus Nanoarchaeia archaeon]
MIIGLINDNGKVRNLLRDMNFYHILTVEEVQDGENHIVELNTNNIQQFQNRKDLLIVRVGQKMPKDGFEKMADVVILPEGDMKEKVEKVVADHLYQLQDERPDWDHYFMNIAEQVKMRCTCMSSKKGAVIVKEKMIISTGYNGTPKGIKHCTLGGCQRCTSRHLGRLKSGQYTEPCICNHSEENAIVQAAYNGASTKGAIMYTTYTPCTMCAKMIINAGITEVMARVNYPDPVGQRLFKEAGVKLTIL